MDMLVYILAGLGIIGLCSTGALLVYFFTSIGKNVRLLEMSDPMPAFSSDGFLKTLAAVSAGTVGRLEAEDIELINEGHNFFTQLYTDIEAAQHHVHIATYVWKAHPRVRELLELLKQRAREGIRVRLLIDHFGSSLDEATVENLISAGVKVGIFRSLAPGKLSRYHKRTHRRAIVIDDTIAYFGGMAVSDEWFGEHASKERIYTDVMYRVKREVVHHLESAFNTLWTAVTGEVLVSTSPVEKSSKPSNFIHINHRPQIDIHPLTYVLWSVISAAQSDITLVSPYFVPGSVLEHALLERARAGIKVTIILQGKSELALVKQASQSYYEDFLAAGIKIYEYQPHHLHSKILVVDGVCSVLGSANYDIRSQRINLENIICYVDRAFAQQQLTLLQHYIADSKEIDIDQFQGFNRIQTWRYKLLYLLSEQF